MSPPSRCTTPTGRRPGPPRETDKLTAVASDLTVWMIAGDVLGWLLESPE